VDLIDDAAYRLVHEFRDGPRSGAPALAPLVNMNAGTLLNKANPHQEHQFTVREIVAIESATGRSLMLQAHATLLGFTVIPLGDFDSTSDVELLSLYANYHAEVGDVATAVRRALNDKRISRREYERIRREFMEATQAGMEFLARLEAIAE
jgi:hypothetical protein